MNAGAILTPGRVAVMAECLSGFAIGPVTLDNTHPPNLSDCQLQRF